MKKGKWLYKLSRWVMDITMGLMVIIFMVFSYVFFFQQDKPVDFLVFDKQYQLVSSKLPPLLFLSEEGKETFNKVSITPVEYEVSLTKSSGWLIVYLKFTYNLALYFFLALFLSKLVRSVEHQRFFHKVNVFRLRLIGYLLLIDAIIEKANRFYSDYVFDKYLESEVIVRSRISFERILPDILSNTAIAGILVLILAQAFHYGLQLEKENELTI